MENTTITFDKSVKKEILKFLNKDVNEEGLIVESLTPSQKVLAFDDGDEVRIEDFGGVKKGSEVFIKNNLVSLMKLSKK